MKVTHIKGNTLGSNFGEGWWATNGVPKFHPCVVVEVVEGWDNCVTELVSFLIRQGVKQVQILPFNSLGPRSTNVT